MKYYSPTTKGFYDKEVHSTIPDDVVEITDEYWQELLGGEIVFDGTKPIRKVYTKKELAEKEKLVKISEAKLYLKETDWVEMYHLKHLSKIELIDDKSDKWEIINKRAELKKFLSQN